MKQYPGYTLVKREDCPEQHGTLTVLTHDVSGAAVLLVENDDDILPNMTANPPVRRANASNRIFCGSFSFHSAFICLNACSSVSSSLQNSLDI